jgi:hypothetical protein
MRARTPRLIISGCLAVFVLAGLLAIGYLAWDPEPPRDPDAVALRIRFVSGMGEGPGMPRPVPAVTVYGDGRIITEGYDLSTTPGRSVVRDARLTREAYRQAYRDARVAGLATSRTYESDAQIVDGGLTVVELRSGGRLHETTLHAGAIGPRPWLIDRLVKGLRKVRRSDLVRPAVEYRPARMAITAWRPEKTSYGTIKEERPWPLRPLTEGCAVLTGTEAREALRLAASAESVGWHSGPHVYLVRFLPLLPEERTCPQPSP